MGIAGMASPGCIFPGDDPSSVIHGQGSLDPAGLHVLVIPWLFDSLWRVVPCAVEAR